MRANNVLGIIYSNSYDSSLSELTAMRTMGSVPFGGRYRLIDFMLSNFVNCGISRVAVLTNSNFRSLMDHLGSGRPWDLSRKRDGLFIFPPFTTSDNSHAGSRIDVLSRILEFISASNQEYVLLCDSNTVYNTDLNALFSFHEEHNADITVVGKYGKIPALDDIMVMNVDDDAHVQSVAISPKTDAEVMYSTNTILMRKALLERIIRDAESYSYNDFYRDVFQKNSGSYRVCCYELTSYCRTVDGVVSYFNANLELLSGDVRRDLFAPDRPVYTKIRNDMPVVYGDTASVSDSLISDGCMIDGTVEGSVLSRGVRIAKGAVVRNCILMQDTYVGDGVHLECVIADKSAVITPGKSLIAAKTYPMYVAKQVII